MLNDSEIGWWVQSVPYAIHLAENNDPLQSIQRTYLYKSTIPSDHVKLEKCKGRARKYFQAKVYNKRWVNKTLHIEGRTYYLISTGGVNPPFKVIIPKPFAVDSLIVNLEPISEVWFELASLICLRLSSKSSDEEIIDILRKTSSIGGSCTSISHKMAKSLIRIAATRIFSVPEQSILELPVNSIDSYNPDAKVGKFGMGFFSILYWLIGHPKRQLVIDSFYKGGAYTVLIKEVNDALSFRLITKPTSVVTLTGTKISIIAEKDPFKKNGFMFMDQLQKLKYSSLASIYVNYSKLNNRKDDVQYIDPKVNKEIFCQVLSGQITVEDYAQGIPLSVLFGSLFVPSISTKKISLASTKVDATYSVEILQETGESKLLILVGGVVVVSITPKKFYGEVFLIHLSSEVRLPVSRDDVLIDASNAQLFSNAIESILELSVVQSRKNKKSPIYKITADIQILLDAYIAYTPSETTKEIVQDRLNAFSEKYKHVLVPENFYIHFKQISNLFLSSNTFDVYSIESFLSETKDVIKHDNIWDGVRVVFLEQSEGYNSNFSANDFGLPNYLFISETYRKSLGVKWVDIITESYNKRVLYKATFANVYENNLSEYEKVYYDALTPLAKNTLFSTLSTLENQFGKVYEMKKENYKMLEEFRDGLLFLSSFLSEANFLLILQSLRSDISQIKGDDTYGGQLLSLSMSRIGHIARVIYDIIGEAFFVQLIIASMTRYRLNPNYARFDILYIWWAVLLPPFTFYGIEGKNNPLVSLALKEAKNFAEYAFFSLGYGTGLVTSNLSDHFTSITLKAFVKRSYVKMRARGGHTLSNLAIFASHFGTTWEDLLTAREYARNYAILITNAPRKIQKPIITPSKSIPFKLTQLINQTFKEELPSENAVITEQMAFFKRASSFSSELPLQMIEIAVNEGTVKDPIDASLTEIIQNSIDILRETKNTYPIEVTYGLSEDEAKVIISVTDYVGMGNSAFVYIGIPFLSTKTPSEIVTGEMGSGFFNVYRQTEMVMITSVKNGVQRTSVDIPIKDKSGRVVDIQKNVSYGKTTTASKTTITLVIPTKSKTDAADVLSRIAYFSKSVISLSSFPGTYVVNEEHMNAQKVFVSRVGKFIEIYAIGSSLDVESQNPSYLLTKGIPMSPLADVLKGLIADDAINVISDGYIVNITHGGYTPVQTRTKINMPDAIKRDLIKAAQHLVFLYVFRANAKHNTKYISNMRSGAPANQLRFANYSVYLPMVDRYQNYLAYYAYEDNLTIAEYINKCIDIIGDTPLKKNSKDKKDKILWDKVKETLSKYHTQNKAIETGVVNLCVKWLMNKNKHVKSRSDAPGGGASDASGGDVSDASGGDVSDASEKTQSESKSLTHIFSILVNLYWEIALKLKIIGISGNAPKVIVYNTHNPSDGWSGLYIPKDHTVKYEVGTFDNKEIILFRKLVESGNVNSLLDGMKFTKFWQDYFSEASVSSTFPHELEHARMRESHTTAAHGIQTGELWPGGGVATRTFPERTNEIWNKIKMDGFWEKALKKLYRKYLAAAILK